MLVRVLVLLVLLLSPALAEATTRYVIPGAGGTGCSNPDTDYDPVANTCGSGTDIVYTTIAGGVTATAASDTLLVRAGTYTNQEITNPASGTALAYTTIRGYGTERPVLLNTASVAGVNFSGSVHRSYVEINQFEFNQSSVCLRIFTPSTNISHHIRFINNICHEIAGSGLLIDARTSDHVFADNLLYRIGVTGAGTGGGRNVIYGTGSRTLVENNIIHDSPHGINVYSSVGGRPQDNVIVRGNTLYHIGRADLPGNEWMAGQNPCCAIRHASLGSGIQIYDNLIYDSTAVGITLSVSYSGTAASIFNNTIYNMVDNSAAIHTDTGTGAVVRNNIAYLGGGITIDAGTGSQSNNLTTDPSFVNAAAGNFTLAAGSAALGTGTTSIRPCNGTCEIGRYEVLTYSSATINEAFLDVTLGMNLNVPVQPTAAGWSAACSGGANCGTPVVSAASKLTGTDSVVRLTLTGLGGGAVCEVGQTWTVSYNSATGATTDTTPSSAVFHQELSTFTTQAVTNACGVAPPADPGTPLIIYLLDDNTGTVADNTGSSGAADDGTLTNGPLWVAAKHLFGLLMDGIDDFLAIPYGSGVNPTTQSLTFCFDILPTPGTETGSSYGIFGPTVGTNQRGYIANISGTWSQAIQASGAGVNTEFPVAAGWTYLCQVYNSTSDTVTMYVNAQVGTSAQSVKAYTSYTFASDFRLGQFSGGGLASGTYNEFRLYESALSAADIQDLYDAWEPPAPPAGGTFSQVGHQFHLLRRTAGGAVDNYGALNVASMPVVAGGALMVTMQTDCTGSNCDPISEQLRYSCALCASAGAWLTVPDTVGPDGISFYGEAASSDPDILKGVVTCCLSGALTTTDGLTNITASAVPVFDLAQNASVVQRFVLKFDATASGMTFFLKAYNQTGEVFAAYTPTAGAGVVVVPMSAGSAF